ncbi:MAG TPA: hypothetical protein DEU93_10110, partial [Chitinophagaceae bacterium]|nr:hypothetical protein [Chitinophagaceae bacterium]
MYNLKILFNHMKINLHNYETWFLMYTDNELSAAERNEVEQFVQEHPELQDLFLEFQSLVLTPENTVYEPVTDLIKLNSQPVESLLLRYLDDELNSEETAAVQKLIQQDAAVAEEWALLQQTRLQPEKIVFENKAALYKKPARVISFAFYRRLAAAAILTGAGIFTGLQILNQQDSPENILASQKKPVQQTTNIQSAESVQGVQQNQPTTAPIGERLIEASNRESANIAHTAVQPSGSNTTAHHSTVVVSNPILDGVNTVKPEKNQTLEKINNTTSNKIETPNVSYVVSDLEKIKTTEQDADEPQLAMYT